MNSLGKFLNRTTMYRLMLYFMSMLLAVAVLLSALGFLPFSARGILLQTALFVAFSWGLNSIVSRFFKTKPNPESSIITGLILAALAGPLFLPNQWPVLAVMAGAAIVSKYVLAFRKSHIFNPAAFGAVASAILIGHPASWWIGIQAMLPFVLAGGLLMTWKIRRFHLVFGFLGLYLVLFLLSAFLFQERSVVEIAGSLQGIFFSSPLLFFSFVMLVEPLTSPQTARHRIAFGGSVALVWFLFQQLTAIPYSLELSLLVGNGAARIFNPDFRQSFSLKRKELLDGMGNFWFEPARSFSFRAGQFLEYTLWHPRSDSRGIRRYFTIASSPTEQHILLATKFADPGSSFKKTLKEMEEGGEIVASKVAGEFVLPKEKDQKLAFIAGGIGITPFRSMVRYLLDTGEKRDIVLLYGARKKEDLVFLEIFRAAEEAFGMKTVPVLSNNPGAIGRKGFIDETVITEEMSDFRERLFYVSGPESMVQAMEKLLKDMRVPARQIKRDYFPGYEE